jgi:O-antigen ligase
MNRSSPPVPAPLEKAVWLHTTVFILGASWVYGGNIGWMQTALSAWGSAGAALTVLAFCQTGTAGREARGKLLWLVPLALFTCLVAMSATNPSFRQVNMGGETAFIKGTPRHPGWPSSIAPLFSLKALWFSAGVYLSAFNLLLVPRNRLTLRVFLAFLAINTFVLSVFGTLQKLTGTGYYFGAADSPNPRFFATFIYNNHWGAFMMLGLTTAVGLLFHYGRKREGRDLWHSPFSGLLVGVLFIAACAPMSASRASTMLTVAVMTGATLHALVRVAASRRRQGLDFWPPAILIGGLALATTGAVAWLAHQPITERYSETRRTIEQNKSLFGGRAELYRDTWKLARQKPLFGWGLNTFAVGFQLIRPIDINYRDDNFTPYSNAHNDWLQSVAETGFVGTALLVLMGAVPLSSLPRRVIGHPLVLYPLIGCALVLFYAFVEFPFGSGAVMITFWTLFFGVIRHAKLTADARQSHA